MKAIIRKKLKLDSKIKAGIITILSFSAIFLSISIYKGANAHKVKSEEKVVYEYSCQPKADYLVHIHENTVYEGTVQEENLNYSKKLLDSIEINFSTEFQGSREAETEFVYRVTAKVQGYENLKEEAPVVNWSKNYDLLEEKKKITTEHHFLEEVTVQFGLEEYDAFALEAREVTGMELSNQVVVSLEGNLTIHMEEGDLITPVAVSVTIPLQEEVFNISKDNLEPISDAIIEHVYIPVPPNRLLLFGLAILMFLCVIGIMILCIATEPPNAYDVMKANAKRMIKNYGSRMIAIQSKTDHNYHQTYELNSIEDLIKVSDEVQKPIYYIKDEMDIIGDYLLQVVDGDSLYVFHIA